MPLIFRHNTDETISISVKNFPRKVRGMQGVVGLTLSVICREEDHRTISKFKNLNILAQNVEAAYVRCFRNALSRKDLEVSTTTNLDSIWKKILELRSSVRLEFQCSEEFNDAVLCVGEEEYRDWPYQWWNYEQYRKMRHTWAGFFRSGLQWERSLALPTL